MAYVIEIKEVKQVKKIIAIMAVILASITTVATAEFSEYSVYYDFENYNVEYGSGEGPDGSWGVASMKSGSSYIPSAKRKNFGSAVDSETNSRVISVKNTGEPVLKFGELKNQGKFHISFDVKPVSAGSGFYIGFYDGTNEMTGPSDMIETNYAIGPWFHKNGFIQYSYNGNKSGNDMKWTYHWRTTKSGINYELGNWYHVDMYFEEWGEQTALAYYYIDGQLINQNPIYFNTCAGFKGLYFRIEGAGNEVYIDNVYVKNFKGEEALVGVLENSMIERENSKLRIRLIEPASRVVTKDDITITSNRTGAAITDFEVTSNSERIIDIKINSLPEGGRYTVKLSDEVVGMYYGNPMKSGLVFRTPAKEVEGVQCPDVEEISYYLFDGVKQNASSGISTATEKIEVKFTTSVSDENIESNVLLEKDGETAAYAHVLSNDGKTLEIYPIGLLEPAANYKVTVTTGVAAAENENATMEDEYSESFTTLDDAKYEIKTEGIVKTGKEISFPVRIIKTNTEKHKYTYAAAAYKKHTVSTADGDKTYYEMTAFNRCPVVIEEQEKGLFEFDCNEPLNTEGASVFKGYLWNYPENTIALEK